MTERATMKCKTCRGDCLKVNKFVSKCCRCSGITYGLQCSECHENVVVKRKAAGAGASDSSLKDKGKTLAVKSSTQAATYGIKKVFAKSDEKALEKAGRKAARDSAGKTLGTGTKLIKGAGTPWQLGAVAAEFGAEAIAGAAGANKTVQTVTGKLVGVGTSAAIGAAVAGPVGAAGAVALWGVGEGVSQAVDAITEATTYAPVSPYDPVTPTPMCDICHTSMAIPVYSEDGLNLCYNCSAEN